MHKPVATEHNPLIEGLPGEWIAGITDLTKSSKPAKRGDTRDGPGKRTASPDTGEANSSNDSRNAQMDATVFDQGR
jgi:hypothetical protein